MPSVILVVPLPSVLTHVGSKVLRTDDMVRPVNGTLQLAPKAFNGVRVNVTFGILAFGVAYRVVLQVQQVGYLVVAVHFVGHHPCAFGDM